MLAGSLIFRNVPTDLIEDEKRLGARRDPFANLIEMKLHGFRIAGRQHEGSAGSEFRANRTE
jgi:hypothetical protein